MIQQAGINPAAIGSDTHTYMPVEYLHTQREVLHMVLLCAHIHVVVWVPVSMVN